MAAGLILFCLLGPMGRVAGAAELEILSLSHRTAQELITLLRPLAGPGVTLGGMNHQLILKGPARELEELKAVVRTLDQPLRSLLITVATGEEGRQGGMGGEVAGRLPVGRHGEVRLGGVGGEAPAGIALGVGQGERSFREGGTQRVRVVEGQPAFIRVGESRPVVRERVHRSGNWQWVERSTDSVEAGSGFSVVPRVAGEVVTLEIAPAHSRFLHPRGAAVGGHEIATRVQGRLGEWLDLGGMVQSVERSEGGLGGGGMVAGERSLAVRVKVELVP